MAGVPKWKKEKEKRLLPENYRPTKKQIEAYEYCVRNGIRISPVATDNNDLGKWKVGISTPDDYKKIYKSPETCDKHSIMEVMYNYCIYYYDKQIRNSK